MKRLLATIFFLFLSVAAFAEKPITPRTTTDTPTITILDGTADSDPTPTATAHEAVVHLKFGTVSGSYTTCTMQAKTTFDNNSWFTLGSAVSVTVTTGTENAWTVMARIGTFGVITTSSASSTVAPDFGLATKFTFACSGGYGTSAPATLSLIYR